MKNPGQFSVRRRMNVVLATVVLLVVGMVVLALLGIMVAGDVDAVLGAFRP